MIQAAERRIDAIDALRGLALFGVLVVNLDTEFRVTFFEQFAPQYASRADALVRAAIGLLIEFKAITIFSMLFGVGLAIQRETLARRGPAARLLVRRLVALPFVLAPTRVTLAGSGAALLLFWAVPMLPIPFPTPAWIVRHVADAREVYGDGSFGQVLRFRIAETPAIGLFDLFIFPRTLALILFGAWAWRSGVLRDPGAHARLLGRVGWTGLIAGLLLSWLDGAGVPAPVALPPGLAHGVDVVAPVVLAIGYAALALRYLDRLARLIGWAAPVGRMAFSNYLAQSVILGLFFYGYGVALLGRVGVVAGVAISAAVFAAQTIASRWWLSRHRFGPMEWLWRTGMYGRAQPWGVGRSG